MLSVQHLTCCSAVVRQAAAPFGGVSENPVVGAFVTRWPDTNAESTRRFYERKDELERQSAAMRFERKYPGRDDGEWHSHYPRTA